MSNINCTQFKAGKCLHQAAPRSFFGTALCILEMQRDERIKSCALQIETARPKMPPKAP